MGNKTAPNESHNGQRPQTCENKLAYWLVSSADSVDFSATPSLFTIRMPSTPRWLRMRFSVSSTSDACANHSNAGSEWRPLRSNLNRILHKGLKTPLETRFAAEAAAKATRKVLYHCGSTRCCSVARRKQWPLKSASSSRSQTRKHLLLRSVCSALAASPQPAALTAVLVCDQTPLHSARCWPPSQRGTGARPSHSTALYL